MTDQRVRELCRRLKPVLGRKIDTLWAVYMADGSAASKAELEQTLEQLAIQHLGSSYEPDRSPFTPPPQDGVGHSGGLPLGEIRYAGRAVRPFALSADRLKEHTLVCGRSGSGKTNLTLLLVEAIMQRGIHVLAVDWKRGYRDLLQRRSDLRVYTIGRDVSPLRFNPLIPPPGCEPQVWIKLIVDVIAGAYLGGEGVISLLVAGLDHLYREAGGDDGVMQRRPTVSDLLAWLRQTKLTGRAAMWKASAERILLAMTYGEFAAVVDTQDNRDVLGLLDGHAVLEMDGLSSNADRKLFSEALTLYLYRYRLAQGPRAKLTNVIVLEEAHNLLLAGNESGRESVLESAIRMVRQYGLGYVFVDQSASMLSKVAFANSYAMIAMNQKLAGDVRAMAGAMNLNDEQKQALSTLPVGSAVVRLADEHPEPFLIHVPRSPVQEGAVDDEQVRRSTRGDQPADRTNSSDSRAIPVQWPPEPGVTPIPPADKKARSSITDPSNHPSSHPPAEDSTGESSPDNDTPPTGQEESSGPPKMSREAVRYLADVARRPLSTTVERYQRLHFSRRRGNAIRRQMLDAGLVETVRLATRSGQVVLGELTDAGRTMCERLGIAPGPGSGPGPAPGSAPRTSLEHAYWARRAAIHFEDDGYEVTAEQAVRGNGTIDLHAEKDGEHVDIEIETGRSDIRRNLEKAAHAGFDRIVVIATNPHAVTQCQKALAAVDSAVARPVEMWSWLDIS